MHIKFNSLNNHSFLVKYILSNHVKKKKIICQNKQFVLNFKA